MTDEAQQHHTFTIERIYPSCTSEVWAAWSVAEKKNRWFGGGLSESDFRVGGTEKNEFTDDLGTHTNQTIYFEIKELERIVCAYSMALNGTVHSVSLSTVVFTHENGGTRLTYTEQMCVIPPSDGVEGRTQGWNALLDALGAYLRPSSSTGAS